MKNFKKGSAELISIIILVVIGASVALFVAASQSKNVENTNTVVQSKINQISL